VDDESDPDSFRWHQVVVPLDLLSIEHRPHAVNESGICFLGFCCDEGVRRNLGRTGAALAPAIIRREMSDFPNIFNGRAKIFDAGDIHCDERDLESAQEAVGQAVNMILNLDLFPILIGGGHEITYGHYNGISRFLRDRNPTGNPLIGIVNFDAHFDMRPYDNGPNSGTTFLQLADLCRGQQLPFSPFYFGIQKYCNTVTLFKKADELKARHVLAKDMTEANETRICRMLNRFIRNQDYLYVTICADVFSSAFAPGVSSPQPFGLLPEMVLFYLKQVLRSGIVVSFDIAEVSPRFDDDNRTAKLAAIVIFAVITTLLNAEAPDSEGLPPEGQPCRKWESTGKAISDCY